MYKDEGFGWDRLVRDALSEKVTCKQRCNWNKHFSKQLVHIESEPGVNPSISLVCHYFDSINIFQALDLCRIPWLDDENTEMNEKGMALPS